MFPPFCLDFTNQCLWRDDKRIELMPKAFAVLKQLVQAAGELVTKEKLLELVWPETHVGDAVLKVCVGEIRRALCDQCKSPRYIETLHRRGYRFIAVIDETPEAPQIPTIGAAAVPFHSTNPAPETHYARSGDVNIAYQVLGDGPLDLIFVMGWVSHVEYFWTEPSFARFLRRLASFSRLILFDKRGTGLSDRVPVSQLPTLEQRMDDVRAVLDAVGSERAALCGVSEGGPMAALFAATYPEKTAALIMIGAYARRLRAPGYPWGPTEEEREKYCQQIETHWGGPVGLEQRAPSVASDPAFREWWATYLRRGASPSAAAALTRMNAGIDIRHVLPTIRVPTLVLHRSGDQCLQVEEGRFVAASIPGAQFVELPGRDHLPFVGEQDDVLGEIEEFLTGIRHTLGPDRVLATVLYFEFQAGVQDDPWERLRPPVNREIDWFRGRSLMDKNMAGALFDGPARGVRCACAIGTHARRLGVVMRAGLHTAEFDVSGPAIGGLGAEIAGQVLMKAHWGEILVSSTVRDLVAGSGLRFEECGVLKREDLSAEWCLLRVDWKPANRSAL